MPNSPSLPQKTCTAAILAGGQSRRMGQLKEGVPLWDGRPMIEHVAEALQPLSQKIAVVGNCTGYHWSSKSNWELVSDIRPGHGPLSALEALLSSGLDNHYLVTACDQPLLTAEVLALLLEQAEPDELVFFQTEAGEKRDPFPGIYPVSFLPAVQQALNEGRFSIRQLIQAHSARYVTLPDSQLACLSNANTPEAVADLQQVAKHLQECVV